MLVNRVVSVATTRTTHSSRWLWSARGARNGTKAVNYKMRQRYSTTPKKDPRPEWQRAVDERAEKGLPFECPFTHLFGAGSHYQFSCDTCPFRGKECKTDRWVPVYTPRPPKPLVVGLSDDLVALCEMYGAVSARLSTSLAVGDEVLLTSYPPQVLARVAERCDGTFCYTYKFERI